MKKIILLSLLFFIPNLVLASESHWWCGYNSRIYKCYWSALTGQLEIPEEDKLLANIFPDAPIMEKVALAESGKKQFNADGSVVTSRTQDKGFFQINAPLYKNKALAMGLDIDTLTGNFIFARYLYDNGGLRHWNASKAGWGK